MDQLRRELAERKGAVEHDRAALEALQQQSQARRARSRAGDSPDPSRPWSGTNDPAKEAKARGTAGRGAVSQEHCWEVAVPN